MSFKVIWFGFESFFLIMIGLFVIIWLGVCILIGVGCWILSNGLFNKLYNVLFLCSLFCNIFCVGLNSVVSWNIYFFELFFWIGWMEVSFEVRISLLKVIEFLLKYFWSKELVMIVIVNGIVIWVVESVVIGLFLCNIIDFVR